MKITPLERWMHQKIAGDKALLTRDIIEARQLQKLYETVLWAKKQSLYYGARLSGFKEDSLSSLKDLAFLPFTTAEDIRRNPLDFLCVSQSEFNRVVTLPTSGTTGDPKRIHFTPEDQELTMDFFHCGMSTLVESGERVLTLLPGSTPGSVGDLLIKSLDRLGAVGIPHGPVVDALQTLEIMAREKVDSLVGIPVQVLALARLGRGRVAPRTVLLSTDHAPHAIVSELENAWGCEVFTHYGMTEMGYGGGVECQAHFGYHLREADLLFEIVDPITGAPIEEGKPGEVVFTTLTRRGMPLIRYRTGDISRFIPEKCPCGTLLRSLERIGGRIGEGVTLRGSGALSIMDLDEALFRVGGLLNFHAILKRGAKRDKLQIQIHAMEDAADTLARQALSSLDAISVLKEACEADLLSVAVEVRREGWIPSTGSAKRSIAVE